MVARDADESLDGAHGDITLCDGNGNPAPGQQPLARITIDLYSLDRLVTVKYLVPEGSELESLFTRSPEQATSWRTLVGTLKRNLEEIVEIKEREWWRPEDARFRAGQRVRMIGDPSYPEPACGTVADVPPRRVGPGVLYRILLDEAQENRHTGERHLTVEALEAFLEPLPE